MAIVPMPLEPPWTRKRSPGLNRPAAEPKSIDHTVQVTSGRAAASTRDTPDGTAISCPTGTATLSAYPPPASSAHTSSPTLHPATASPTALIVPEHSIPRISDAPGGGG